MSDEMDFTLRDELRKLEGEMDRLERDSLAPSWERERIVGLEKRMVLMQESLARIEARLGEATVAQENAMAALRKADEAAHRLDAYDAMCLSARMHDQVFLTAGEVKALSMAFDIRVGALDAKVKALEERLADDGR